MRGRSVVALVGLLAGLLVASSSAGAAGPTMTVSPHTDLVDGQELVIRVHNWPGGNNHYLVVNECRAGAHPRVARCDSMGTISPNDDGFGRLRTTADVIADMVGDTVDCRVRACEISAWDPNDNRAPVLRAPVQYDPASPDPTRPLISVTPHDDVRDGDEVTVGAEGFPLGYYSPREGGGPARPVDVFQCRTPARSYLDCDHRQIEVGMTPTGDFTSPFTVDARIYLDRGETVDCRSEPCAVLATENFDFSEAGLVPLAFAADSPGPPPPTLTATPDTGLVDGQPITITAENLEPGETVQLALCPPGATGAEFLVCHDVFALRQTNATGQVTFVHSAHALIEPSDAPVVDCRTVTCSFVVTWSSYVDHAPAAPILLDPATPLVHHRLRATPSTGLAPRQEVTVTGEDFYSTNRVRVSQCVLRRANPTRPACGPSRLVRLDPPAHQTFTTTLEVRRRFRSNGFRFDCVRRYCFLFVDDFPEQQHVRSPRLVFTP